MNKMAQNAPISFRNRMFETNSNTLKERRILALRTSLVGLEHYIENEDEQNALINITPGTELLLFREVDNKYDKWAVAAYLTNDDKIGYLRRDKNQTVARLMDAGKKFVCVVNDPKDDNECRKEEDKQRWIKYYEEHKGELLPVSVYLIEEN